MMLNQQLATLQQPIDELIGTDRTRGDLLSDLRGHVGLILQEYGYKKGSGGSIAGVFERRLEAEGAEPSEKLIADIETAAALVKDIHSELKANTQQPGEPATRAGVSQQEIAQTLRDVANYLKALDVGPAHNKIAEQWLSPGNLPDQIEQADQEGLRAIFGKGDKQHYWPGKVIPTLIDVKDVLKFRAYRELLDGPNSEAQQLLDRIEAFRGTYGSNHLAFTSEDHERYRYIENTSRHSSETYVQPDEPWINRANIANFTYDWTDGKWLPVSADEVECRLVLGGVNTYSGSNYLAGMKATIEDGLRRGSIDGEVTVELGTTYGEDAVVVRLSTDEYRKLVALKLGKGEFDLTDDTSEHQLHGPGTSEYYSGFEPEKRAFYANDGLMIDRAALASNHPNAVAIAAKLAWLKASGCLKQNETTLDDGRNKSPALFVTLELDDPIRRGEDSFQVDNRYYDSHGLHDRFNVVRRELYELVNETTIPDRHGQRSSEAVDTTIVDVDGDLYTDNSAPFKQVGHHFRAVYKLKHDWTTSDKTPEGLHGQSHRFFLNELPEDRRESVKTALLETLNRVIADIDAGGDGMIGLIDPSRRSM